ncbi:MAG: GMC oxidoreductase [Armatimonadota bacterium]|nr:GMC oxidoreductase [Armatimonadota bacterium]
MIASLADSPEIQDVRADLCIVGAGAVGLDLARVFDGSRVAVVVVESGGGQRRQEIQELARVRWTAMPVRPDGPVLAVGLDPARHAEGSIRQLGGTTNVWSGKWKPLHADDFEARSWSPQAEWPLSYAELRPYYLEVARSYGVPAALFDRRLDWFGLSRGAERVLRRSYHYQMRVPLNFGEAFRIVMERSRNVTVILDATTIRLVTDSMGRVDHVVAGSVRGDTLRVQAREFVLAAGGLENARLLFASREGEAASRIPGDVLGRYYMDHPKLVWGRLTPARPHRLRHMLRRGTSAGMLHFGFTLSPETRMRIEVPHHSTYLMPSSTDTTCYDLVHYLEQLPCSDSRVYPSPQERNGLGQAVMVLHWTVTDWEIEALRRYLNVLGEAMGDCGFGRVDYPEPQPSREHLSDAAHYMGTTRMATSSEYGVVDRDCKVFGIANLYMAGSSVFPSGGNANPTLTILALARRLARRLRQSLAC